MSRRAPVNLEGLRFNVLRNALYHQERRRWLERTSRFLNLAVILLGTAAVADLLASSGFSAWIGVAVALTGSLQLVYDFGRRAAEHAMLQRDYFRLLAEIDEDGSDDPAKLARWYAAMLRISGEEAPVMRAVDAIAYNAALDAMELPDGERLRIPFWRQALAHLCAFGGTRFAKMGERRFEPDLF